MSTIQSKHYEPDASTSTGPSALTSDSLGDIHITKTRRWLMKCTRLLVLVVVFGYIFVFIPKFASASSLIYAQGKPNEPRRLQAVQLPEHIFPHQHDTSATKSPFSSLRGPHITQNFPDPCIIHQNGTTYAFATNNRKLGSDHIRVQVATSRNNKTWDLQPHLDALPHIVHWQTGQAVWAPDVKRLPNGTFILYYTDGLSSAPQKHCIGAALSDSVTGPYVPLENPLVCPHGGAIDPAGFLDRSTGKRYLIYKIDGNSLGHGGSCNNDVLPIIPTPIMLQQVDENDGITLIGTPTQIMDRDILDGPLIEAPAIYLSTEGIYFLFFSSNCFTTPLYNIDYATATNITGPYIRASRPLLITGDGGDVDIVGPGGMDIIHHDYSAREVETSVHKNNKHKHKGEKEKEGHIIVFHGHMTVHNTPSESDTQHPIQDLHQPFTRGMYSGTVYFRGRKVSLSKSGFEKADTEGEEGDEL